MSVLDLATIKEKEGAEKGLYPPNWPEVALKVKEEMGWKCERCGMPHGSALDGECLTVHHLDGNKWNLERWNLAALCQRCHLSVQGRVDWRQTLLVGIHKDWMIPHIVGYNEWAKARGLPLHDLVPSLSAGEAKVRP